MNRTERFQGLERQIERLERRIGSLRIVSRRLSWLRLAILLAGVAISYGAFHFGGELAGWLTILLFVAIFIVVARLHQRIEHGIERHAVWRQIKIARAARMRLDWEHIPPAQSFQLDDEHPFEIDLDLTGPRSLHRLIDSAVTLEGSSRLREWLIEEAHDLETIARRQAVVRELIPLTIFRDKLALLTHFASKGPGEKWAAEGLLRWLQGGTATNVIRRAFLIGTALSLTMVALLILTFVFDFPPYWIAALAIYTFYMNAQKITGETLDDAVSLELKLSRFAAAFRYLESYRYGKNDHLRTLCTPFHDPASRPSREFRKVSSIVAWASFKTNPLLWGIMNFAFPLSLFLALLLNRSKDALREHLPRWLDTWFELEALGSLAGFGWLNPRYTFPEVMEERSDDGPIFAAHELGHPLIPEERKSRNNFAFDHAGEITLITGSNMAGKSTFLRTLGINLVLAYAGAPVDAASFRTILFRPYSSIRINDSLSDGFSFFYAEVRRLRRLLDELERGHPRPLFFLIDEIFRGTNNRERLIGSRSYIRALAGQHGVGMIATHDLELVHLAEEIPNITNRHFREEVIDGTMIFDYTLREGPCPTTNALIIMKMAGLPVEER
jgi:hypothetical protein